jgi:hypothetical protein
VEPVCTQIFRQSPMMSLSDPLIPNHINSQRGGHQQQRTHLILLDTGAEATPISGTTHMALLLMMISAWDHGLRNELHQLCLVCIIMMPRFPHIRFPPGHTTLQYQPSAPLQT